MKKMALVFVIFPLICLSQQNQLFFKHLNRENGLSNSTVEKIFQDSRGFIWIGTADGLNRFDGYQFEVFQKENETRYIIDNYILDIKEDNQNRIWVATSNGAALYNEFLDAFTGKRQPGFNIVRTICQVNKNIILCGTDKGINFYNEEKSAFYPFTQPDFIKYGVQKFRINVILQDKNENIWIGTERDGIYLFNKHFRFLQIFKNEGAENIINCIAEDKKGIIWVGFRGNGICRYENYQLTQYYTSVEADKNSLSGNVVKCILVDNNNKIWIGTENGGLNIYNPLENNFIRYQNEVSQPSSLSQQTVSTIMEDTQNNIWIGTHRGGINIYSPVINKFRFYTQGTDNKSLSFKDIKSFFELNDGRILIGTDGGGLNIWNRQTYEFTHYRHNANDKNSISSNAVLSTFQDSHGQVWVGTWQGGLNKFNPATNTFFAYRHNPLFPNSICSDNIWKVIEDNNNQLWLATSNDGICVYSPTTGIFRQLARSASGKTKIYGQRISELTKDKAGNIWIATYDGGLVKYDAATSEFEQHFVERNDKETIYREITTVFCDLEGNIWTAPLTGLYKFDKASNIFTDAGFESLRAFRITSINEDNNGNLWCGSQNGLLKITKSTGKFARYTAADGLQGLDFSKNTTLKLKSGELLFGGYNGFNIFNPSDITTNTIPPPVFITNFSILGENILPSDKKGAPLKQQIFDKGQIVLNYEQARMFSFEFAALNYISTEKNQYAYKLEGFNDNWNYTGTERKITFTNLDPGRYTLYVKASNNDGVWNTKGAIVHINILSPFWKTWWFRLLIIIAITSLAVAYLRMHKNLIARKLHEKKQDEMYNMQLDFFTHISHEFRTPLSLIMGAAEKMEEIDDRIGLKKYYLLLHKNVTRIVDLVKEIMDFRKIESGIIKLKVEEGNFEDSIQQITEDFIPIAERKNINFEISIPDNENTKAWFDKQFIERIALNLLNNAFKYTNEHGSIGIEVLHSLKQFTPTFRGHIEYKSGHEYNDYLYLRVKDSGTGIPADALQQLFERFYRIPNTKLGSGLGLAFVKKLVLLHKGVIHVYSEENKGTDIIIGVPYKYSDFNEEERTPPKAGLGLQNTPELEFNTPGIDDVEDLSVPNHEVATDKKNIEVNKEFDILIVEDNEDMRTFLKYHLQEFYNIHEATNGSEGLVKAKEIAPSLIITDVMMPEMDGMEMCIQLKQNSATSHIPIIMLTAKDSEEAKARGMESGADYYFTKPLSTKLLQTTIKNIFRRNTQLKSHFLSDYQHDIREKIHSAKEREIIDALLLIIDSHIDDTNLNIEYLCRNMGMSKTKLFNVVKKATGKSANELIRITRLKKSVYIMANEDASIADIMSRVGISSPSYFTRAFKAEFGKTPTEYYKELKKG